jgi:hypothetical protein
MAANLSFQAKAHVSITKMRLYSQGDVVSGSVSLNCNLRTMKIYMYSMYIWIKNLSHSAYRYEKPEWRS